MPNISDLPLEILDLIFSQVIGKRVRRGDEGGSQTAGLRLVCRAWADWLYEHHLYRLLTFADASEPLAFISLLGRRSKILPPAKCQHLEVHKIWTSEDPPPSDERNWINLKIVENLLDLFINLITLELGFLDFFNLPSQLIKAIGRFKGLQTLYLCYTYWRRCELDSTVAMDDPTWFNSLIMEVQTLKSLRLSLPLSLPCKPDPIKMAGTQYPSITHLTVNIGHLSLEVLLALCTAFKPTLKLLSIFDTALETDVQLLLPIYETVRERIEGLSVTTVSFLTPIHNLSFPKLRMLAINSYVDSISMTNLLSQDIFAHAPINTLAICCSSMQRCKDNFTVDTLSNLPQLKKLVFTKSHPEVLPAPIYLAACQAHHIKCIYVNHDDDSQLMKL